MTFFPTDVLRTGLIGAVCALIVASVAMIAHAQAAGAAFAPGTAPAMASSDAAVDRASQDMNRRGERCQAGGFCWILPARAARVPERLALSAPPPAPHSDRATSKWLSGPPDQPPRNIGR